ncbi:uncharacterized protein DSM5745_09542 [Aspergillus mulundensis]|uniref:Amino acid permease/ SLC12A domain-containing protein n=1 Tax=Aspergillus mulundensis TaxID=1810919 RepID=A0A3D8QVB7_9EURO|nr:hypothetical protein DSM5745_09542 [Aspergillus mulundensis]RDW65803.1 hypothetical protein DSM5745_09542 [Aspergillus mulundensis]
MAAGEAENPRRLMGKAFSSFVWRLMFFFIGGALCVGIVIPYDDQMLADMISGEREGSGTGAASPYVISMVKFGIKGVPDLVNALIITSVLSAGNNVIFSAARTLHGMALDGKAPSLFAKCNKYGLPYYAVITALTFSFLSLLQIGSTSATVLNWFVGICTASYLLNYFGAVVTYLHFYYTMQKQGMSRDTLPYKGSFQPFAAWYALVGTFAMTLVLGYTVFIEGGWDTTTFFTSYTMVGVFVVALVGWKVLRRTRRPASPRLRTKLDHGHKLTPSLFNRPLLEELNVTLHGLEQRNSAPTTVLHNIDDRSARTNRLETPNLVKEMVASAPMLKALHLEPNKFFYACLGTQPEGPDVLEGFQSTDVRTP